MCGLAGIFDRTQSSNGQHLAAVVGRMAASLHHRGPDDGGVWTDAEAGMALGHRRLSIIDLSPTGRQPMVSGCGRYVIGYNGEIYNATELRRELADAGTEFVGTSDTEVILEACATWDIEVAIRRLNGMFAFAVWDRAERELYLVRDRLGIKPIYWGHIGADFVFASELKALRQHESWSPELNRDAVAALMRHNYVPAPHSIFKNIFKLEPGHVLRVSAGHEPTTEQYWDLSEVARHGASHPTELSDTEAVDALEKLLYDAVGRRMVADVPLGAFLSGGIDSSTVVALMQVQSSRPIRTFTIGFHEARFDEAPYAKAVAQHLGTDHTELYVQPKDAYSVIPQLPDFYDEPFADSSQIPTYLVSRLARSSVTVALSGDGGDELFAGYDRYFHAEALRRTTAFVPRSILKAVESSVKSISPRNWDRILALSPRPIRRQLNGHRLHNAVALLALDPVERYRHQISHWSDPLSIVRTNQEAESVTWEESFEKCVPDPVSRMQLIDSLTYLPDDILTKVDRASMAVSLEVRVPLLDHRVVEFAWQLPRSMVRRGNKGKWLLRKVLSRHLPEALVDRPKMGFGVPIGEWLRGPLRDWAESLLGRRGLLEDEIFDPTPVLRRWSEHLSGARNWQYSLWNVLMYQAWRERWLSS